MSSDEKKLLIFGVDGATFDLLDEWMASGKLPFFEELAEEGVTSELKSTMPPVTGPAWTSFQTGVNPGKHGIYDWGISGGGEYDGGVVDSTDVKTKNMWSLLSEAGKRVVSVGLPVTYPPQRVNGVMTSGVLTPNGAEDYVYPPELKEEIEKEVGEYVTAPTHAEMAVNTKAWIKELKESVTNKEKTSRYLLDKEDWDVSMVYFMETDTVMHHLFHTLEEEEADDPDWSPAGSVENPILEIFRRVDEAMENIATDAETEELSILVVSDHGFGPLNWIFNVNSWLYREGYLALKDNFFTRFKKMAGRMGFNQKNLYDVGNLLGPLGKSKKWDMEGINDILGKMFLSFDDIDWSRTKAFSRGGVTGQLRINLKGREPEGIVEQNDKEEVKRELMENLSELKSPHTGDRVIEKVMAREEVYSGPYTGLGPDILFKTKGMRTDTGGMTVFKTMDPIIPAFAISGTHRMNGVFFASGSGFRKAERVKEMNIIDSLPNILYLLGLDVPKYLDGSVREDLYEDGFVRDNEPNYVSVDMENKEGGEPEDHEDEEIKDRLKNLGYLA